jgi:hypothetical protein
MSRRYVYPGACHCRNLEVRLESDQTPAELGARRDTCSFCTKHHAVYTSDPAGEVHLACGDVSLVERYRFGTRTAEFLLCKACGVLVAATMSEPAVAVVNVNVLDACTAFLTHPISVLDVERESVEQRLARRGARWTPLRSFLTSTVAAAAVVPR